MLTKQAGARLVCFMPTTSAQIGQKHRAAASFRHVAAFKLKGTVQSNAPLPLMIDACGDFVFSFALIQRRQRSGSVSSKLAVIQHLAQGHISRVDAGRELEKLQTVELQNDPKTSLSVLEQCGCVNHIHSYNSKMITER